MIVCFIGVVLLVTGEVQDKETDTLSVNSTFDTTMILPLICLVSYPFMISTISLMMRQLREVNEFTISVYIQMCAILIYTPIAYLQSENGFGFMAPLEAQDWIMILVTGFTSTCVFICIQKAA
jgi:drug/metabolite transporter (DMT)-like permease